MASGERPSNRRMGYGFKEAKKAGAPFIAPRSGEAMNRDLAQTKASRELRTLFEKDLNHGPKIYQMILQKMSAQEILAILSPQEDEGDAL